MTKAKFEDAVRLRDQIAKLTTTISNMSAAKDFKLEPMTRQSGIYMRFGINESSPILHLNEGEALCIYNALIAEKERLEMEFGRL